MEEGVPPEAVAGAAKAVAPPSSPTASQSSASSSASFGEDAPPRIAALFTDAIAAGYVKEREAKGMMKGVVAQLRSGKVTEDACVAQTTKKLAGMKAKSEKKKKQAEKKKANKAKQEQAAKQRKALLHTPETLLADLADPDEAAQLRGAKNITATSLKLQGRRMREFQDAMGPGLPALVAMAERTPGVAKDTERCTAAFDALHRMLMYHKEHSASVADTSMIPTINSVLLNRSFSLQLRTHASNVLNTIATNCFDSHVPMMAAGVISCLVDYVQDSGATTRTRNTSMISPRNDAPVQKTVNPAVRELIESFDSEEKLIAVVRGLPGSGKSNLCAPLPLLSLPLIMAGTRELSAVWLAGRKSSAICAGAG
jgi:hypothetical protein